MCLSNTDYYTNDFFRAYDRSYTLITASNLGNFVIHTIDPSISVTTAKRTLLGNTNSYVAVDYVGQTSSGLTTVDGTGNYIFCLSDTNSNIDVYIHEYNSIALSPHGSTVVSASKSISLSSHGVAMTKDGSGNIYALTSDGYVSVINTKKDYSSFSVTTSFPVVTAPILGSYAKDICCDGSFIYITIDTGSAAYIYKYTLSGFFVEKRIVELQASYLGAFGYYGVGKLKFDSKNLVMYGFSNSSVKYKTLFFDPRTLEVCLSVDNNVYTLTALAGINDVVGDGHFLYQAGYETNTSSTDTILFEIEFESPDVSARALFLERPLDVDMGGSPVTNYCYWPILSSKNLVTNTGSPALVGAGPFNFAHIASDGIRKTLTVRGKILAAVTSGSLMYVNFKSTFSGTTNQYGTITIYNAPGDPAMYTMTLTSFSPALFPTLDGFATITAYVTGGTGTIYSFGLEYIWS